MTRISRGFQPLLLESGDVMDDAQSAAAHKLGAVASIGRDSHDSAADRLSGTWDETDALVQGDGKSKPQAVALGRQLCMLPSTGLICAIWLCADMASGWWTWTPTFATTQRVQASHVYHLRHISIRTGILN